MGGRTVQVLTAALTLAGVAGSALTAGAQAVPDAEQRAQRYQIGVMERVLENAVEHGASVTRDRLRPVLPAEMLLSESAEARGFRLRNYGLFFDVLVPSLEGMLPWVFRTLDRHDLGLESALAALRSMVEQAGDVNLQQALRRIELQVAPFAAQATGPAPLTSSQAGTQAGSRTAQAAGQAPAGSRAPADPILSNPEEAYRTEVMSALMDAMLDHSRGLELGPDEWLTVGARRSETPRLGLGDGPARTIQIAVRGADLQAFLEGSISREDARRRMDVRVF